MAKQEAQRQTKKLRELAKLKARMHPKDRAAFERAQRKFKPNLDHDLWTASMFVPPRSSSADV